MSRLPSQTIIRSLSNLDMARDEEDEEEEEEEEEGGGGGGGGRVVSLQAVDTPYEGGPASADEDRFYF